MRNDKDKIEKGEVSRRDFLVGAGAVVVGGAIGAGITYPLVAGKGGEVVTTTKTVSVPTTVTATTTVGGGATTVTATTTKTVGAGETVTTTIPGTTVTKTVGDGGAVEPWQEPEETVIKCFGFSGSGGAEPCAVDVKNGRVVRIRPLHYDEKYTKEELAPSNWKFEARGKTFEPGMKSLPSYFAFGYKKRVYSPNRILYPLKRVDWEPGGVNVNPENRGKSKYKRISWDEATTIVASEIKRVQEKYGPLAILGMGDGHGENKTVHGPHGCLKKLLALTGGFTDATRNADSWEGWNWGTKHVWGTGSRGLLLPADNQLKDIAENSDMIVFWGCDLETTAQGFYGACGSRLLTWFRDLGIKQIMISPELNYQNVAHTDKWIPVLPNTDAALQLAIAYTWINEHTATNPMYDEAYVDTHTVGFDKVKAYVMGDEDGVPKTPKWASPRCGVPVWTIKALAREWASKVTSVGHEHGGAFIRGPYSHEPARLESILLGMQGLGKPGVHQLASVGLGKPRTNPTASTAAGKGTSKYPKQKQFIPKTMIHHAILNPPVTWWGTTGGGDTPEAQLIKYEYPIPKEEGGTEIHMIWEDNACLIACWTDGNMWIEAYRSPKIECIVLEHQWFENDCLFADIVLPVNTKVEEDDIFTASAGGCARHSIAIQGKAIESIGESMSDYEMVVEVAKKLGLDKNLTEGRSVEEWIKYAYENSGVTDLISWEKLNEKGFYIPPVATDWKEDPPGVRKFYEDPAKDPLPMPSGKLEFYSQRLAENFPDDEERGPIPKWVVGGPGKFEGGLVSGWSHDETLWGERCKKYTMLLISNHPHWRHHTQNDDVSWFREILTCKVKGPDGYMYESVWLNPVDAAKRGIETGDIVKIYNERGAVLGGAYVNERIIPGAVYQDHGARTDMIICDPDIPQSEWLDRGGNNNLICPEIGVSKHCWGMAVSGYLVEVEKLTGDQMEEWRRKYPEAFARDYDPAYGLKFGAWVEGGM